MTTTTGSTRDWSLFYPNYLNVFSLLKPSDPCDHGCFFVFCLWQVFEKFTKESTSLLDELSIINDSDKSSSVDKDKYAHAHTNAQSCILRCTNSRQSLRFFLCSADQLIVPSCRPSTLRLSCRPVNIILFKPLSDMHIVILYECYFNVYILV